MPKEQQHLSYDEFVSLLQHSTVLQGRQAAERYSKEDLLQAARDLEIEPALAGELVDAYIARRGALELAPRPFNTRILLSAAPEEFRLTIPPLPFRGANLVVLAFLGFVVTFLSFFTPAAFRSGTVFPIVFLLPFWAAALGMAWRFGMPLVQTTRLSVGRDEGTMKTTPFGRTRILRTAALKPRLGDQPHHRIEGAAAGHFPANALLLENGAETLVLLHGFSEQEQRWVESELRAWLLVTNPGA